MATTKEIVAKSKGEVVGTATLDWPENLSEAVSMSDEATVFSLYSQALILSERAKLYPKAASAAKKIDKKEVYDSMIAAGIDDATARSVSKYED